MYVLNGAGATSEGEDWAVGTWAAPANAPDPFDGNWHFFATTYDNYTVKVFLDYTVVSTFRSGGFMPTNTNPLRIGSSGDPSHNLVGSLSDISVYNYALPESAVFENVCTLAKYDIGNRDCKIDFSDFAAFAAQWMQTGSGLSADFDGDKGVNLADFSEFALNWLQTN
jgi:hypothetical protein